MLTGLTSPVHIMVVLVVALLVLGPDQLPGAARKTARYVGDFRRWWVSMETQLRETARTELDVELPSLNAVTGFSGLGAIDTIGNIADFVGQKVTTPAPAAAPSVIDVPFEVVAAAPAAEPTPAEGRDGAFPDACSFS